MRNDLPSKSARFALRPLGAKDDPAAFQRWAADPRIMHPLNLPARALTAQQVQAYWGSFNNQTRYFIGIFDGPISVGFWEVEIDPIHKRATVSMGFDMDYRGASALIESAITLFDWLFGQLGVAKIVTYCLPRNRHAMAMNHLGGFRDEGFLRGEVLSLVDGKTRLDQVRLGLLPDDWKIARDTGLPMIARKMARRAGRTIKDINKQKEKEHVYV